MYGTIASYDALMQNYYKINTDLKEHIQVFCHPNGGALDQIWTKFPHMLSDEDMETHFRDRLSARVCGISFAMVRSQMTNE